MRASVALVIIASPCSLPNPGSGLCPGRINASIFGMMNSGLHTASAAVATSNTNSAVSGSQQA